MVQTIIVVCTGNICRSPIAEALLKDGLLGSRIAVESAGIAALVNRPADSLAQLVVRENGGDISGHRAQQASQQLLSSSDLILTLDQTHQDWIRARFPQLLGRTFKLGRWRNNQDVADPYQQPKQAFENAYVQIGGYVNDWIGRLKSS